MTVVMPSFLRDISWMVSGRRASGATEGKGVTGVHEVANAEQATAELPTGVEVGEVLGGRSRGAG